MKKIKTIHVGQKSDDVIVLSSNICWRKDEESINVSNLLVGFVNSWNSGHREAVIIVDWPREEWPFGFAVAVELSNTSSSPTSSKPVFQMVISEWSHFSLHSDSIQSLVCWSRSDVIIHFRDKTCPPSRNHCCGWKFVQWNASVPNKKLMFIFSAMALVLFFVSCFFSHSTGFPFLSWCPPFDIHSETSKWWHCRSGNASAV